MAATKPSVIRASLSAGTTSLAQRASTATRSALESRATTISRPLTSEGDEILKQAYDISSRHEEDAYASLYNTPLVDSQLTILEPIFNPRQLAKLPLQNNTLGPCIAAMVTNVDGFGFTLEYIGEEGQDESEEAMQEKKRLMSLAKQPNPEESLTDLRGKVRKDLESVGWAGIEVIRGGDGAVVAYYHVPAHTLRQTTQEQVGVPTDVWIERDGELRLETLKRRFRRYVQILEGKTAKDKIWFKEFGDERIIDPATGKADAEGVDFEGGATELIFLGDYTPGQPYPLPKWICQIPSILGSWESELTNLQFFKDNGIPAMAVLVAGGVLSQKTIDDIRAAFTAKRGQASMNRVVVIEAQPHPDYSNASIEGTAPAPKMELKPLAGERQQDALFGEYDKANQDKVRSAFRLPPIFLGRSDDYTRATAESSLDTAESQVFAPEREKFDTMMNLRILLDADGKPPKFWRFRSNPARISNLDTIVKALDGLEGSGAMTPNQAIMLANELFGKERKPIKEEWGDAPFSVVLELVKSGKIKGSHFIASLAAEEDAQAKLEADAAAAAAEAAKNMPPGTPRAKPTTQPTPPPAK